MPKSVGIKPKQIMMSAPMVRAILEGKKTQTRRIVKMPIWASERIERVGRDSLRAFSRKDRSERTIECPYGPVDRMLLVRECVILHRTLPEVIGYCADGVEATEHWMRKQSAMRMPNFAARLLLRVTDIRVELLHDISPHDARAEGFASVKHLRELWEKLHGTGAWDANPWVWAISFPAYKAGQKP